MKLRPRGVKNCKLRFILIQVNQETVIDITKSIIDIGQVNLEEVQLTADKGVCVREVTYHLSHHM